MTPITAGEAILQAIDYILKTYPENFDKIGELDKQQCDIQHMIEFTPLDIQRGYRLAKQMQDVRKERRSLKDENELLRHLYDFLNQGSNQAFKNGFANALQRAKQREKTLTLRIYHPRSDAIWQSETDEAVTACD